MAVNLSPIGGVAGQFFDNNGNPLSGGKIFTYSAGTTTPQATYTSANGGTPHANPIILDAAGRVPGGEIWLTDGLQYKFIIQTSTSVQIGSYDNVIGINSNFVNYTNSQEIQTATAGQTVFTLTTMQYQPATNSLSVFVDGVNQYGPGAMYAYQETSSTVVTFTAGLHVGAQVKFVTSSINASSYGDAEQINYTPPFIGSVSTNVEAKLAQTVSVIDFGATGDGLTDDTSAIQAAIDAVSILGGGKVILPAGYTFLIGAVAYVGIATGVAGIVLKNNITLQLDGTLKVKNSAYGTGAFYGAIRSLDAGLSNASIIGKGTVDGNSAGQIPNTQASNIYLTCVQNVTVEDINCVNANGMGIQLVPVTGATHTACSVNNTSVNGATNIGIQVSHGLNLTINNNRIRSCTNNAIDVYGDDGDTTPDNGLITICGNTIGTALTGVFLETTNRTSVVGNTVSGATTGYHVNRINGAPSNITITGNVSETCDTALIVSGDTEGVLITGNAFGFGSVGMQFGFTGGNVSYAVAENNMLKPTSTTAPLISLVGNVASFLVIKNNYYVNTGHTALVSITAGTATGCVVENPINTAVTYWPVTRVNSGTLASGGTSVITAPVGWYAGKLVIKATAGGAWHSVWSGSFITNGTRVSVTQDSTTFTTPGNAISSVTGSASTLDITVTWAATGSAGVWAAYLEYL